MGSEGGIFDRRDELVNLLRQGPESTKQSTKAEEPVTPSPAGVVQSRWQLTSIRQAVPWLQNYSLSGVWYLLRRYGLKLRTASVQQYSPDPEYRSKVEQMLTCLRQTAQAPARTVFLFMDQMGYYRWPEPGEVWSEGAPAQAPQTDRQNSKQEQWRLIGVLNALTGQVNYLDGYIVGRAKVIAMYEQIATTYAWADRIFVAQDNWSIHKHEDVTTALAKLPTIQPVWLPTYSPWLNPIEKLWRWLRHDILTAHRLASDWPLLRKHVNGFLTSLPQVPNHFCATLVYLAPVSSHPPFVHLDYRF
ncbi:MAG: IS630 family transposase [Caldilineaceae bacterium]